MNLRNLREEIPVDLREFLDAELKSPKLAVNNNKNKVAWDLSSLFIRGSAKPFHNKQYPHTMPISCSTRLRGGTRIGTSERFNLSILWN